MKLFFIKDGFVTIQNEQGINEHWKIKEHIHNSGRVFLNLLRSGRVKTVRIK